MKFTASFVAVVATQFASVLAHGGVTSFSIGSTTYPGWQPFNSPSGQVTAGRPYTSFNPILNPSDSTLHCNNGGESGPSQQSITINAGDTIYAYWPQWTHAEGPVTVYMAACPGTSCTGYSSASASWFKIAEQGLISGTLNKGQWANGILMKDLKWPATIPSCLKPGPYLIRFETLALHQANTPQFYPECAQLIVQGSGSTVPSGVKIPGAWGNNDPGVIVDIYSTAAQTTTTYIIPGPPVFKCGGGSGPASTTPRPGSTTVGPTTTSSRPTTTSAGSGPAQTAYGQCGGQGWAGATTCVSGYKCVVSNQFYSQCLPA
ncbi:hypothetical protein FRC03_011124 [Tulasnella sp. 419]|nr:hypothetical protein FRC02_007478 [Tulasnella sp. 418]KAG8955512.1 hypothetical protein FRC03_011124 [Tulasnella sp. 419]